MSEIEPIEAFVFHYPSGGGGSCSETLLEYELCETALESPCGTVCELDRSRVLDERIQLAPHTTDAPYNRTTILRGTGDACGVLLRTPRMPDLSILSD